MKRFISTTLILVTLLLLTPVVSYALSANAGEITFVVEYKKSPIKDFNLSVVCVATAEEVNGKIVYNLTDEFKGCTADLTKLYDYTKKEYNTENVKNASSVLNSYVENHSSIVLTSGVTDANGAVKFTKLKPNDKAGLAPGLYLVVPGNNSSSYKMAPSLVAVPMVEEGTGYINYLVTAKPKVEPEPEPGTTEPTTQPTTSPTTEPTTKPTTESTTEPTSKPTTESTTEPTTKPSEESTTKPSEEDSTEPGTEPTTPSPETTTEPSTEPTLEPTTHYMPPNPPYEDLEETPVPGVYVHFDDDNKPHYYIYDEELEEWVEVDEDGVPLAGREPEELPQTGLLQWPIPVLCVIGVLTLGSGLVIVIKGNGKKRGEK